MFDKQGDALRDALERRPRGLKNGDNVEYAGRRFTVFAIQQWMAGGAPHAVGLVWGSRCPECNKRWHQCTSTRPGSLSEVCPACDVLGSQEPTLDARVAKELLTASREATASVSPDRGAKRRGRVEAHVIECAGLFSGRDAMKLDEFITTVTEKMPAPGEGERDTRRQRVTRAVETLGKEQGGPLFLKNGLVTFTF